MKTNNFDKYTNKISIDESTKLENMDELLSKTKLKINMSKEKKRKILNIKNLIAACLILAFLSGFIPSTPINALYKQVFQFIPGLGVIESHEDFVIKSTLENPVKYIFEDEFIEIKYAYTTKDYFNISIVTNLGNNLTHLSEKYITPTENKNSIYLIYGDEKVEMKNYSLSGSSETGVFSIEGAFYIDEATIKTNNFDILFANENKTISIELTDVKEGYSKDSMASNITINNIMVFADTKRIDNTFIVNLSTVSPKDYLNARFYLFDYEKECFENELYIIDNNGKKYYANEALRIENNDDVNTFYFYVPEGKEISELVIPQIIYSRNIDSNTKILMPSKDEVSIINKEYKIGDSTLKINNATFIDNENISIHFSYNKENDSSENILRVIPSVKVKKLFNYYYPSSGVHAKPWHLEDNEGIIYLNFDEMLDTKSFIIDLKVKYALVGPFKLNLNLGE